MDVIHCHDGFAFGFVVDVFEESIIFSDLFRGGIRELAVKACKYLSCARRRALLKEMADSAKEGPV